MEGELPVSGSADLHPPKTRLGQEGLQLPVLRDLPGKAGMRRCHGWGNQVQ